MGWNEWQEGEVSYCAMPVAHIGGTGWCLVGLINGVKTVVALLAAVAAAVSGVVSGSLPSVIARSNALPAELPPRLPILQKESRLPPDLDPAKRPR